MQHNDTIKLPELHVGDPVFHEFKLGTVYSIRDERVTGVHDGHFVTSGHDMQVVPVNAATIRHSKTFEHLYESINAVAGATNINNPAIKAKLVEQWLLTLKLEDPALGYEEAQTFVRAVIEKIKDLRAAEVDGIKILR